MTRFTQLTIASLLLLLAASACSKSIQDSGSQSPTGPAGTPRLTEDKRVASVDVVKAAPSGEVRIRLTIQSGFHINANPPTYPYLIATTLEISPADGVSVGSVTYPKPLSRKFVFAEKALAVYEGETEVKATLKSDKSAKQGQQSLAAKLRIQACDDQVCYPPGTLDLIIPVTTK